MNKNLKSLGVRIISIGLILSAILLERYVERVYLNSEIMYSFRSHLFIYFLISIVVTITYWIFESKNIKPKSFKLFSTAIVFGLSIYLSHRMELWLNSQTQKKVKNQDFIVQLKGIAWGEIGIKDLKTGEIDHLKIKEDKIKEMSENDTITLGFKEGVFGFKYSPSIEMK